MILPSRIQPSQLCWNAVQTKNSKGTIEYGGNVIKTWEVLIAGFGY
jgi:hypothetical protein